MVGCETTDPVVTATEFSNPTEVAPKPRNGFEAGDTIELSVEVGGTMEVVSYRTALGPEGIVTLPLVGDVTLSGCTLGEAQDKIAETYGAYYIERPVIMLSLVTNGTDAGAFGTVIVLGKVRQPGRIALTNMNGMNLTEVIQEAGGFAASAKTSEIRVTRTDQDGRKKQVKIDYTAIGKGGDASADVKLISGDIVFVPERIW